MLMTQPVAFETWILSRLEVVQAIRKRIVEQLEPFCYPIRDVLTMRLAIDAIGD